VVDATVIGALARWIDRRVGAGPLVRTAADKVFPAHWSFLLGEIALYALVVLLVTGTFLALHFDASLAEVTYRGGYAPLAGREVSAAFASTLRLSFDVPAGLFVRQVHHWAALVFVAAIVIHLLRVFFTGAFRRPRELTWLAGVGLLVVALIEGFAGYSLPDDLLSGTGLRIAFSFLQSVPVVGAPMALAIFGGEFPGEVIIGRLFIGHVWILPAALIGLVTVHLALVARQKHTQFAGPGRREDNVVGERLWPTYAARSVGLLLLLTALLSLLGAVAQINPVWLYGPYDPAQVSTGAQPDWYFGWIEGAMRLFPSVAIVVAGYEVTNVFFPAVLLPTVTFLGLALWPFLDQWLTGAARQDHHLLERPREHPARTSFGIGAVVFYTVLLIAGSNDLVAATTGIAVGAVVNLLRVALLVLPVLAALVTWRVCWYLRAADRHAAHRASVRRAIEDRAIEDRAIEDRAIEDRA
jgi:ubiquinol-cytochrome c reductase cytochrome b subunit